jgi:hypothetical protein
MISVKLSGEIDRRLKQRLDAWSKNASIAASVRVPPELAWWYWNEFGTASKAEPGYGSGSSYEITVDTAPFLVYRGREGNLIEAISVSHPGIRPARNVRKALPELNDKIAFAIGNLIKEGGLDTPQQFHTEVQVLAGAAKQLIVEQMALNMDGPDEETEKDKQYGRLKGQKAADVFDQSAQVIDTTK